MKKETVIGIDIGGTNTVIGAVSENGSIIAETGIITTEYPEIESFVEDELALIIPKSHPFAIKNKKVINKDDLYHLNFITLNSNSTIRKFIDNILIQNNIETKQFNIIMQLNSIEAIKTAVSLGLGAAFVSSSAIEKEIELKTIEIVNIENIKITRTLSIIANPDCYRSKAFEFFYNELWTLKNTMRTLKN